MTNATTTGLVERSTSWIADIPWKVAEFESQSSSPKDLFLLTYFFFIFFGGVGGGRNGKSTAFWYQWYENLVHCNFILENRKLAGMAARGSELYYTIFLLSSKHDNFYFDSVANFITLLRERSGSVVEC